MFVQGRNQMNFMVHTLRYECTLMVRFLRF